MVASGGMLDDKRNVFVEVGVTVLSSGILNLCDILPLHFFPRDALLGRGACCTW